MIAQNLAHIRKQIKQCECHSETQSAVKLLAVSKTKPIEDILTAYKAGQMAFGENYVQEGVEKIQFCQQHQIELEWHFIGPLQSNKTRLVAEHFDWIQTVDRFKIAERLNDQRPEHLPPLNVLIQINISDESSKSGIQPEEMFSLAEKISQFPRLKLRGLMAIPKPESEPEQQKISLRKMKDLFNRLQQRFESVDTLSMGMSDDMASAIECGSTMVRIGTAIFGERDYSQKV